MEPIESHQRAEVVTSILRDLGLVAVATEAWWSSRPDELNGLSPAEAWVGGYHLVVEHLVANLLESATELGRRLGALTPARLI
jgi:hypothetical protein